MSRYCHNPKTAADDYTTKKVNKKYLPEYSVPFKYPLSTPTAHAIRHRRVERDRGRLEVDRRAAPDVDQNAEIEDSRKEETKE